MAISPASKKPNVPKLFPRRSNGTAYGMGLWRNYPVTLADAGLMMAET
jgi:hypothetical protein